MAKKDSGLPSITYSEALDIALCYGWIDGQKGALDEQFYLQKFTPRRSKSLWSKRNVERVDALIKTGKMRAPGLAAVETARKDGRWERAYDSHRTSAMPPDLEEALEANPRAKALFSTLDKANIYAILWRGRLAEAGGDSQGPSREIHRDAERGEEDPSLSQVWSTDEKLIGISSETTLLHGCRFVERIAGISDTL